MHSIQSCYTHLYVKPNGKGLCAEGRHTGVKKRGGGGFLFEMVLITWYRRSKNKKIGQQWIKNESKVVKSVSKVCQKCVKNGSKVDF